jgi:hypothetical protein
LWNGDLSQAEQILASGFTVNAAIVGVDGRCRPRRGANVAFWGSPGAVPRPGRKDHDNDQ